MNFSLLFLLLKRRNKIFSILLSDSGHQADGEMAAGSEEQPKQIRQLHPEDADCYPAQRWRSNRAGQDGVNKIKSPHLSFVLLGFSFKHTCERIK